MSGSTTALQRVYEVHGVGVEVRAHDQAVIDAMELRLRGFGRGADASGDVRLDFFLDLNDYDHHPPTGESRPVYDTPHGSLHYFPDGDALWGELAGVELLCEPARGVALIRSAEFTGRALYLATHPVATISLMELLERRGLYSVHAACFANDDGRGVLVAGASGAGKSTLSLALTRAGLRFLSDDLVFLARNGEAEPVRALGFADAVGITEHAADQFDDLRGALEEPPADGFPKRLVRIEELFGVPACRACEPHALVFPEVARGQLSAIAPLDPREALLRLVPDVLLTEPSATQAHLRAIGALLDQVRCYALRSGIDLARAAEFVQALVLKN